MASSSEFEEIKYVYQNQNIQDALTSEGVAVLGTKTLGGINVRCILSHPNFSETLPFPAVGRKVYQFRVLPFGLKQSSKGFYKSVGTSRWSATLRRSTHLSLLRRLSYRRKVKRYAQSSLVRALSILQAAGFILNVTSQT